MDDLILNENVAEISEDLLNLLNAKPGDRILIAYGYGKDNSLVPVICVNENGNKLSKKRTFICTGKQKMYLLQYGDRFKASKESNTIYLNGNNTSNFKVFDSVKNAVEYTLSKEIINNENFNIKKLNNYEL